jgi:hypothetical protein
LQINVGVGEMVDGVFRKLSSGNKSGIGGLVNTGPVSSTSNNAAEIRKLAFEKFSYLCTPFRNKFQTVEQVELVYPDGTVVNNLPDGKQEFSLNGYRDFVDATLRFDRLRLYLCKAGMYNCSSAQTGLICINIEIQRNRDHVIGE